MRKLLILPLLFALAGTAFAADNGKATGQAATSSSKHYDYYLSGNALDVQPLGASTPMWVLMGGGNDVDAAFQAMIAHARNGGAAKVDAVIVRTSGADGYNPYLLAMDGVDSVETFVIKSRTGANDSWLNDRVANADIVFIAGGDQSSYISLWKGTKLDTTLQTLRSRKVPLGGTSAGLAVLGDVDYTGANGSATSAQVLANPYDRRVTLDVGFISGLYGLGGAITDSHLVTRDRMGRLVGFLARMIKDGLQPLGQARGIGLDEETAVVVNNGQATMMGVGNAYFLMPQVAPAQVVSKKPLEFANLRVAKRGPGSSFDLLAWSLGTVEAGSYSVSATAGVLTSSQSGGSPY